VGAPDGADGRGLAYVLCGRAAAFASFYDHIVAGRAGEQFGFVDGRSIVGAHLPAAEIVLAT
jgi:hypothetical protein